MGRRTSLRRKGAEPRKGLRHSGTCDQLFHPNGVIVCTGATGTGSAVCQVRACDEEIGRRYSSSSSQSSSDSSYTQSSSIGSTSITSSSASQCGQVNRLPILGLESRTIRPSQSGQYALAIPILSFGAPTSFSLTGTRQEKSILPLCIKLGQKEYQKCSKTAPDVRFLAVLVSLPSCATVHPYGPPSALATAARASTSPQP